MPCFHPTTAYRSRHLSASGKRPLVFKADDGLAGSMLQIPCGGCIGCRIDKSQQWATRLMHEAMHHEQKSFITLTYDDVHLPVSGSLDKTHPQKFLKRFRKKHGGKIRYFLCGEYGDTTGRPHYHAIIFGCDWFDKRKHSTNKQGDQLWVSDTLDSLWGMGNCWIGNVTYESCSYVSRYIMKKVTGDRAEQHYARIHPETGLPFQLQPEYIAMSLKPGIGQIHYEKFQSDFYPADCAVVKGRKVPVPRYYDRLLEQTNSQQLETIKTERVKRAKLRREDHTPQRLAAREAVLKSKLSTLTRDL